MEINEKMKEKWEDEKEANLSAGKLQEIRSLVPHVKLFYEPLIGTEDVRQFTYCPRILFFRYILHAPMKQTYKMEVGMEKHERLQELEAKSGKDPKKYFNVYIVDEEMGLVGFLDYFEYDGKEAYPVEIKTGDLPPGTDIGDEMEGVNDNNGPKFNPHSLQVAAQALLIEKKFKCVVNKVKIVYVKHGFVVENLVGIEEKLKVLDIVDKIRKMLSTEKMPSPTSDKGKCVDCECRQYCRRG